MRFVSNRPGGATRRSPLLLTGLLGLLILTMACEKAVELPLPAPPRMLVINTVLVADSLPKVWVFAPQGMLAPGNVRQPEGVTVRIRALSGGAGGTEPGAWLTLTRQLAPDIEAPRPPNQTLYVWTDTTLRFEAGVRYQVEAEAPGYGQARGSALVPPPPVLEPGSVTSRPAFDAGGNRFTRYSLVIQDPPDQGRTYYHLLLDQAVTFIYTPPDWCTQCPTADTITNTFNLFLTPTQGTGASESGEGVVFSNRLVQGQRLPISADASSYSMGGDQSSAKPVVTLRRVDENFFRYFSSLVAHQSGNYGGLFAPEPVTMPNNVEGGAGIVGAANERVYNP